MALGCELIMKSGKTPGCGVPDFRHQGAFLVGARCHSLSRKEIRSCPTRLLQDQGQMPPPGRKTLGLQDDVGGGAQPPWKRASRY
jgi:hypothetical protein